MRRIDLIQGENEIQVVDHVENEQESRETQEEGDGKDNGDYEVEENGEDEEDKKKKCEEVDECNDEDENMEEDEYEEKEKEDSDLSKDVLIKSNFWWMHGNIICLNILNWIVIYLLNKCMNVLNYDMSAGKLCL